MVAARASAKAPVVSGKLAGSYRGTGAQRYGTVKGGGASVPYAGWIDFGGSRRGNNGSVANRAFLKEGRIIFPALMELEPKIIDMYSKALEDLAQRFNNS